MLVLYSKMRGIVCRMNWNNLLFDWNQARALLAVAEEGSLTSAAKALHVSQPTMTRQITALEEELGVTLFERTNRSVTLTKAGLELVEHVRLMADGANLMALAATGQSASIEGLVRVTASELTAAYRLPLIFDQLHELAPNLEIEIVASNEVQDLILREADIAIRHVRPEQQNLIAKLVAEQTMRFYAVEPYIERHGSPAMSDGARQHQFVSFGDTERMLKYLRPIGFDLSRQNFRYASNSQIVELEIVRNGHAIAIATDQDAARFPELKPVLTELEPFSIPVWLVAHREVHTSRRIRLVFDLLAEVLSSLRS